MIFIIFLLYLLFFVFDQFPGCVDQVLEHRVLHRLNNEALAGRIDILTGDLEHTVFITQSAQPFLLLVCVAGGHIGDGIDAFFLQAFKQIIQIVVFKFLCLLVAGDRVANIA